jgi:hypothetical protein
MGIPFASSSALGLGDAREATRARAPSTMACLLRVMKSASMSGPCPGVARLASRRREHEGLAFSVDMETACWLSIPCRALDEAIARAGPSNLDKESGAVACLLLHEI